MLYPDDPSIDEIKKMFHESQEPDLPLIPTTQILSEWTVNGKRKKPSGRPIADESGLTEEQLRRRFNAREYYARKKEKKKEGEGRESVCFGA